AVERAYLFPRLGRSRTLRRGSVPRRTLRIQRRNDNQLAAIVALGAAVATAPMAAAQDSIKTDNVTARLVSERIALTPGRTAWLALHFTIRPGWHTYWLNPGDAGEKTDIAWTLPPGFSAGPIQWPAPERLLEPGDIAV